MTELSENHFMMKCPLCNKLFSPDPAVVEVDVGVKGEHGFERIRSVYCVPCGKLITEKGVSHWDLVFEGAIRQEIYPQAPLRMTEELVREIVTNLGGGKLLGDAFVERIFGGKPCQGIAAGEFANRERAVAAILKVAKNLFPIHYDW